MWIVKLCCQRVLLIQMIGLKRTLAMAFQNTLEIQEGAVHIHILQVYILGDNGTNKGRPLSIPSPEVVEEHFLSHDPKQHTVSKIAFKNPGHTTKSSSQPYVKLDPA